MDIGLLDTLVGQSRTQDTIIAAVAGVYSESGGRTTKTIYRLSFFHSWGGLLSLGLARFKL